MNVFLLMVALAGPVEAPKPVMLVPPALVTAAAPSVRIAPEGNSAAESAAPGECRIDGASQVEDAEMEATKVAASAVDSSADAAADVRTLPQPQSDESCTLVGTYAKKRPLSGPWSALRRLEAARIRGDSAEAKRVEPMLGDLLDKAIFEEPD